MRGGWLVLGFVVGLLVVGGAAALSSGEPVSGEVVLGAPNGPNVSVTGASEIELTDPFIDAQTVDLTMNAGNATLSSPGDSDVSVQASEIEGAWTNLTELDVDSAALAVDPNDKPAFTVGGSVSLLNVSDTVAVGDGSPDFVIEGSGTGTVTLRTSTIGETVFAVNQSGTVLDSATTDASGVVTFNQLSLSKHTVSIRRGTGPRLSNLQPSGLQPDSTPTEMRVDLEYTKFSQGNTVDVEFILDGQSVSTQTIGANTTVTESMPARGQTAGKHDLEVIATDTTTGDVTQIDTTYKLPDSVFIRNETMPNTNLTGINVTMTSLGADEVVRNASETNAEIDLTGLPADRPLLIRLENQTSFYNRTVFLDNVFQQQRVYMLNRTFDANTVRFIINDRSGIYSPDSSEILLNRILDVNGSVQYERVSGDFAAVDGHTAIIKDGEPRSMISADELAQADYIALETRYESGKRKRVDVRKTVTMQADVPNREE